MTDREFLIGGDISALARLERGGALYTDGGVPGDAIAIMRHHGCNCFRLRLFVDPDSTGVVVNDLAYTTALAKRVKDSGARLLLNFHYSDTWADPAHQTKPAAWEHLDFEGLVEAVRQHTDESVRALVDAGAAPDIVQVGNEITPGILWPDGKLYDAGDPDEQWTKFASLLRAGVDAAREAVPSARVALHIDKGANRGATKWFFDKVGEHDVDYDIIALSYNRGGTGRWTTSARTYCTPRGTSRRTSSSSKPRTHTRRQTSGAPTGGVTICDGPLLLTGSAIS